MGKTVIFDLDGTLADTSADLIAAANACFEQDWLDPQADARTAFRGGRAMLRLALDRQGGEGIEDEVERLFPHLIEFYSANLHRQTTLYQGAEAALEALSANGWKLGVCTNKPVILAERLLESLGVARYFAGVLGADSLDVRKPHPRHLLETIALVSGDVSRSLLIGDTETDRNAARNAGVPCVLVGFGPDGAAVSSLAPEAVLARYPDLPDLAECMISQR